MTTKPDPAWAYLKSRKAASSAVTMLVALLAVIALSRSDTGLFSLVASGVTPLARLVTIMVGIAIASPLLPEFELDYVASPRRDVRVVHLSIAFLLAVGAGGVLALALHEYTVWAPRLIVFWTFTTLISGKVFGSRFGWLLPALIAMTIALFSQPDATSSWNIIMSGEHSTLLWAILTATVLAGTYSTVR